jgi:type II secretory pathway pseudopilin PulG
LIQILTVIAIIAILAAVLFPVFSRARVESYKADTMNSMRQFYVAYSLYSEDYDVYDESPGMGRLSVSPIVRTSLVEPYGFDLNLCFSKIIPSYGPERQFSCAWSSFPPLTPNHPDYNPMMDAFRTDLSKQGGQFNIKSDYSYDTYIYLPRRTREQQSSPHDKFLISLNLSGAVRATWQHHTMVPPPGQSGP